MNIGKKGREKESNKDWIATKKGWIWKEIKKYGKELRLRKRKKVGIKKERV